jgi:translation initiation factor 3 subunit B
VLSCSDLWARYQVKADDSFDNIIVVDGVPVIDRSKEDRLLTKIVKEFSKKGAPIKPEDVFMPWDEAADKSKGCVRVHIPVRARSLIHLVYSYMFVTLRNYDDAMFAQQAMNHLAFDSKHTFKINKFTDIEDFADMDETYEEPEVEEYQPRVCDVVCPNCTPSH